MVWLPGWLIGWVLNCQSGSLVDLSVGRLTDCLSHRSVGFRCDCLLFQVIDLSVD